MARLLPPINAISISFSVAEFFIQLSLVSYLSLAYQYEPTAHVGHSFFEYSNIVSKANSDITICWIYWLLICVQLDLDDTTLL